MKKYIIVLIISIFIALFFSYYIFAAFNNLQCTARDYSFSFTEYDCPSFKDTIEQMQYNGPIKRLYGAGALTVSALVLGAYCVYKIKNHVR
jgi:hypothetical protein